MELGRNIRTLRRGAKMSMEELARQIGVSRQTVHRYENGVIENIPREKLSRIAALFGVSVASLFASDGEAPPAKKAPPRVRAVPLLGEIACGVPVFADEQTDGFFVSGDGVRADFCLRARGDSMIGARIFDGDLVFVRAQSTLENGQIGVVLIDDEATLKRVYYYPTEEKLVLLPENPAYEPKVLLGSELETVRILGRAVSFQSAL